MIADEVKAISACLHQQKHDYKKLTYTSITMKFQSKPIFISTVFEAIYGIFVQFIGSAFDLVVYWFI